MMSFQLKAKGNEQYDPNIHYPLYLHLMKIPASRETSMERWYCLVLGFLHIGTLRKNIIIHFLLTLQVFKFECLSLYPFTKQSFRSGILFSHCIHVCPYIQKVLVHPSISHSGCPKHFSFISLKARDRNSPIACTLILIKSIIVIKKG